MTEQNKMYALLDENGIVTQVVVVTSPLWLEAQPNKESYKEYTDENIASIGGTYENGYWYSVKPDGNWVKENGKWIPGTPYPTDGKYYRWDGEYWVESVKKLIGDKWG